MSARSRHLPRRSCHAVPASNGRFVERARGLDADMVFLDLEDSIPPQAKAEAREAAAQAVRVGGWGEKVMCVRVNAWDTPWTYEDVIAVLGGAGPRLDEVMLPKVGSAGEVVALDLLLTQVEANHGLEPGHVGIEVQIESARGLLAVEAITTASPRIEAVVLGPVDFSASMGMPITGGLEVPDYPGDPFHHVLASILVAGRAAGVQVVDGPYVKVRDPDGLRRSALRSQRLGYDGKWSLHPDQIPVLNELFSPTREAFERAAEVLSAYRAAIEDGRRGAVMLGDEMIDEASRQAALAVVARGERAGMRLGAPSGGAD